MPKKAAKKTTKRAYTKKDKVVKDTVVKDKVVKDKVVKDKVSTKKSVKRAADATTAAAKRAGRPKGSGKFGCETKAVRIPTHMIDDVQNYILRKIKGESKKK